MRVEFGTTELGRIIFPISSSIAEAASSPSDAMLPVNESVVTPMVFSGVFSREECARAIEAGERLELRPGHMMDARPDCRRSSIAWLEPDQHTPWLYDRLAQLFLKVNRWYRYELAGFVDSVQFTTYTVGDGFGWHLDAGRGQTSTRKLSMSVQLTEGDEYDGGQLEFCGMGPLGQSRGLGTVIVFPSFLAHRVTPITRGSRRALVAWAHGPAFR